MTNRKLLNSSLQLDKQGNLKPILRCDLYTSIFVRATQQHWLVSQTSSPTPGQLWRPE